MFDVEADTEKREKAADNMIVLSKVLLEEIAVRPVLVKRKKLWKLFIKEIYQFVKTDISYFYDILFRRNLTLFKLFIEKKLSIRENSHLIFFT